MHLPRCSVCDQPLGEPLYTTAAGQKSLTSLCRIYPGETNVFACKKCGHLQTSAIDNIVTYYDSEYDILIDSEEEDQIYEVRDGVPTYRTEHQVRTLLAKLQLNRPVDLLDYGCAKSSTIRELCRVSPTVTPHAFDVSARYIPFWKKFISPENYAVNDTKPEWAAKFDIVTSFFSLEHIPTAVGTVRDIAKLLKPRGTFYCVVPNVLGNIADFIVVDHCNHFTPPSLQRLLADAGLELTAIDDHAHRGAFVVTAKRPDIGAGVESKASRAEVEDTCGELSLLADYWRCAAAKVLARETELQDKDTIAVYGAGFYAAFISANMLSPERIICYLDQNPYLQGKKFNGRCVLAPCELPLDVNTVFVGLNPAHAAEIVAAIPALANRQLKYFYL